MTVENSASPDSLPDQNTAPIADTSAAAAPVNPDVTAESSPAKDASLLDSVKAALKPKTEGSSPSPESQEASPNPDAPSEDDEKEPDSDPTEEEQARYHSKTRKQIRRLLAQRNDALDKVKEMEPEAAGFRKITNFIADSGMTGDEANLLLQVGRDMKRDPLKALETIRPFYEALTKMAGEVLPDDLKKAVEEGGITEPYARQLARARTEAALGNQRVQANEAQTHQRQIAERNQQHADTCASTISTWESNQAKADPDWTLKQGRIGELIELDIRRNGYPQTAQKAVDLAEKARTQVNAEMARFQPRRPAVNPVNPASAARPAPVKPTTALEAARLALAPTG